MAVFNLLLIHLLVLLLPITVLFSRAGAVLAAGAAGILFLIYSVINKDWKWLHSLWFRMAIALWLYYILIAAFIAEYQAEAIKYSALFIIGPLFATALSYWVLANAGRRRTFEISIAFLVAFIIGDSLYQYFVGFDAFGYEAPATRLTGPFGDLIPGTYTLRIIFIAVALLYFSRVFKSEVWRLACVLIALAMGAAFMFLTGERVAFLSYMLGVAVIVAGILIARPASRRYVLGLGGTLAVLMGSLFMTQASMVERTINSTAATVAGFPESVYGGTFATAISIWQDHLWFGVGLKNYRYVCRDTVGTEAVAGEFTCWHPHNIYLEMLVEGGVIGFVLFCLMLLLILKAFFQNHGGRQMPPYFAVAVFLVTFWPFMSSMSINSGWISALIWMSIGWALVITRSWQQ